MRRLTDFPRMRKLVRRRGMLFLAIIMLLSVGQVAASVLVAPTVVILSDKNRTGRMILQNPTDQPKEVEVRFSFGLPESDSLGNVTVRLDDSTVTDPHSCVNWIRAFPRKIVLAPQASQTVRFVANPPKGLAAGEYWARVVVRSQEASQEVPQAVEEGRITTNLNMIMQTAISLKYRTGDLVSALEITDGSARQADSQVVVMLDLVNKGNISYLGVLNCRLLDADKKEISSNKLDLAVYYSMKRKVELPLDSVSHPKPYQVEVTIANEGRTDIPPEDVVRGNQVQYTLTVE